MTNRHYVIVVAEDDPILNDLFSTLLEEAGYKVVSCVSGSAAYETATRLKPDVVITDLHMEEVNAGLHLLEQLRADPTTTNVGVIICSADRFALERNRLQAAELGATLVHKPFDLGSFLATVEQILKQL
jgi:CheY-like chemotaxis protein